MELHFPLMRKMLACILFELKIKLRLSDFSLCKIALARKLRLYGNFQSVKFFERAEILLFLAIMFISVYISTLPAEAKYQEATTYDRKVYL